LPLRIFDHLEEPWALEILSGENRVRSKGHDLGGNRAGALLAQKYDRCESGTGAQIAHPFQALAAIPLLREQHRAKTLSEEFRGQRALDGRTADDDFRAWLPRSQTLLDDSVAGTVVVDQQQTHG